MDAERHLLHHEIGRAIGELQARRKRERTERAMRRDRDVVGFRHRGDPADFGNPAGMAEIGLDDIDGGQLEKPLEVPARIEPFAERDRDMRLSGDLRERLGILRGQRLLDEQRIKGARAWTNRRAIGLWTRP